MSKESAIIHCAHISRKSFCACSGQFEFLTAFSCQGLNHQTLKPVVTIKKIQTDALRERNGRRERGLRANCIFPGYRFALEPNESKLVVSHDDEDQWTSRGPRWPKMVRELADRG